jgi:hypothetical protein
LKLTMMWSKNTGVKLAVVIHPRIRRWLNGAQRPLADRVRQNNAVNRSGEVGRF